MPGRALAGRGLAALALAALAAPMFGGCGAVASGPLLEDVDGASVRPLAVPAGHVHVMVFTSPECPIANGYAPRLRELVREFEGRPVRWFLVHVDPDVDAARAGAHRREFELPGHVLLDPQQRLATELGITRTPEAAVVTSTGLAYRGRIDDQWLRLGSRAPEASQHDLRDALQAVLAGRAVKSPHPAAVGCRLPEPRR